MSNNCEGPTGGQPKSTVPAIVEMPKGHMIGSSSSYYKAEIKRGLHNNGEKEI
jgi:hypothetical protein